MRKKMQKRPKGSHPLHRFEKGKKKQKMAKGTHPHHRQRPRRSSPPVTYAPIHPLPPHPVQLHPKIKQKRKKRQSTPKPSPKIKKKQKKQANRPRFQHHAESSRRSLETAKGGNVTSSEKSFEKNKGKR